VGQGALHEDLPADLGWVDEAVEPPQIVTISLPDRGGRKPSDQAARNPYIRVFLEEFHLPFQPARVGDVVRIRPGEKRTPRQGDAHIECMDDPPWLKRNPSKSGVPAAPSTDDVRGGVSRTVVEAKYFHIGQGLTSQ
jgi:hypothetical protein